MKKEDKNKLVEAEEIVEEATNIQEESGIESFLKKYKNQVIVGAIILVVVVIAGVFLFNSSAKKEEQASLYFSRIEPYVEQGNYEIALKGDDKITVRGEKLKGLIYVVNEYKGTTSGKLAALFAGNCLVNLKKYNEAKEYFEIALDNDSPVVKQGANAGLGNVYEFKKDYKEASDYYKKAAEYAADNEVKGQFVLYAAMCLEKAKDTEKAVANYKEVLNLVPNSEMSDIAKQGLTRLGIVID
jgi:tetratricopeptide (TPR) repeat protein